LHGYGQLRDLRSLLLINWGDQERQQVAQGIDGRMDIAAFAPFLTVIARSRVTRRRRLVGASA
jgi:hypothetical protein